jgi:hypothetical protein
MKELHGCHVDAHRHNPATMHVILPQAQAPRPQPLRLNIFSTTPPVPQRAPQTTLGTVSRDKRSQAVTLYTARLLPTLWKTDGPRTTTFRTCLAPTFTAAAEDTNPRSNNQRENGRGSQFEKELVSTAGPVLSPHFCDVFRDNC